MLFSDPLYSLLRILSTASVQTGFSWPAIVVTTPNDSTSHFIILWSADPLYIYLSLMEKRKGSTSQEQGRVKSTLTQKDKEWVWVHRDLTGFGHTWTRPPCPIPTHGNQWQNKLVSPEMKNTTLILLSEEPLNNKLPITHNAQTGPYKGARKEVQNKWKSISHCRRRNVTVCPTNVPLHLKICWRSIAVNEKPNVKQLFTLFERSYFQQHQVELEHAAIHSAKNQNNQSTTCSLVITAQWQPTMTKSTPCLASLTSFWSFNCLSSIWAEYT